MLESLPGISKWNTSKVTNMNEMFAQCSSLKSLPDISKWDTSNIMYMGGCFSDLSSLIPLSNNEIEEYNKNNKEYIEIGIFDECNSLSSLPDISKWNTSNVTNMYNMFDDCKDNLNIPSKFKS